MRWTGIPIDVCRRRGEERVVLGNAGIVRVIETGRAVTRVSQGEICFLVCIGKTDQFGYAELIYAYDAPGTVGLLARRTAIPERLLFPVPQVDHHSLRQWATYARYWTAWDNWKVAVGCWRTQMRIDPDGMPEPLAFGWGGGVVLAELELARREGFRVAMAASTPARLDTIERLGITPVDRRAFPDLAFDPGRYREDRGYRQRYFASEKAFLNVIAELSDGYGASIILDNIGGPVYRATLRALGRQAVLATVGWKHGMHLETARATECIRRHLHVQTHACCYADIPEIVRYQESTGWLPDVDGDGVYEWNDVPRLARDYAAGRVDTYFPLFQVNA